MLLQVGSCVSNTGGRPATNREDTCPDHREKCKGDWFLLGLLWGHHWSEILKLQVLHFPPEPLGHGHEGQAGTDPPGAGARLALLPPGHLN